MTKILMYLLLKFRYVTVVKNNAVNIIQNHNILEKLCHLDWNIDRLNIIIKIVIIC